MKYKLEFWKYDIFEYEEAENHLNQMAKDGYELYKVTTNYVALAIYRKIDKPSNKVYAVEIMPAKDDDLMQLCEDSGWKQTASLWKVQQIFESRVNGAKHPLYTDRETKYQNAMEVIKHSDTFQLTIFSSIILTFLIYYILKNIHGLPWYMVSFIYFICGAFAVLIGDMIGKCLYQRHLLKMSGKGIGGTKPILLRISGRLTFYLGNLGVLAMLLLVLYINIFVKWNLAGIIITLLAPIIFLTGWSIRIFGKRNGLGGFMMFLGMFLLYFNFSLIAAG